MEDNQRALSELTIEFKYFRGDIEELKKGQKETNTKLEIMKDGYVGREEYREFKAFVGSLATKEELAAEVKTITNRFSLSEKIVFGFIALLLIGFGTVIVNTYIRAPQSQETSK